MLSLIPDFTRTDRPLHLDETVHLAHVFQQNEQEFRVLALTPLPDWRQQLAAVQLYEAPRWNAFDIIQAVHEEDGLPLTVNQLPVPTAWEATYLPTEVVYYDGRKEAARAKLHAAGFVNELIYAERDGLVEHDQFDDRGFCTWRTWYAGDDLQRRTWYTPTGDEVMSMTPDGVLTIAPEQQHRFDVATYPDLPALVAEVAQHALAGSQTAGPFIATLTPEGVNLRNRIPNLQAVTYLSAATQQQLTMQKTQLPLLPATDTVVLPSRLDRQRVAELGKQLDQPILPAVRYMPTYATTLDLGISNELSMQIIAWNVSDLAESEQRQILHGQLKQLRQHDDRSLQIGGIDTDRGKWFAQQLDKWLGADFGFDVDGPEYTLTRDFLAAQADGKLNPDLTSDMQDLQKTPLWQRIADALSFKQRVTVAPDMTASDWAALLHNARLLVDTGGRPNLALQVAAVSAGIPQVTLVASDLLHDGGNGRIVRNPGELTTAVTYYLGTLSHWNEALVCSADLIEEYAAPHIMAAWKEVIG